MAAAVAITHDLIFSTKIVSTGKALGIEVRSAALATAAQNAIKTSNPKVVFIDMSLPEEEAVAAITQAAALETRPAIVAYYSHVDQRLADLAREIGADLTLPRSQFTERLPALLQEYCLGS